MPNPSQQASTDSMSTLIIFDLDGTLADTEYGDNGISAITAAVATAHGCPMETREAFRYSGMSFKERFNEIASVHTRSFSPETLEAMHKDYQARKKSLYNDPNMGLVPGAQDMLSRLSLNPDFVLALASSNE